ncbi:class I SAM-dependent methyltransferase [Pseudonocardia sp. C8]|uniref:class I SAM-dependent methyltransferase n=1 Tax=Pseudonocardia sp. C8 TaxID=2762759 RepID=UPI0016428890|nr:class I SAM-dependent methyltransferase [Pseudonocardia sp. C8]MBC3194349.1 class I SAM-dependent methyltransferase [Pseudonocardia sp. C8]
MSTDYLPALVHPRLLPGYDGFAALMGATGMYWRLVAQAGILPGATVLEIGCGTGNVALRAKRAVPGATVIGLDPDAEALGIARRKAAGEGLDVRFDEGGAEDLPYADAGVDRVLSSLMLHHLAADQQVPALREVRRVLAPGGSLHLVDMDVDPRAGGPMNVLHRAFSLLNRLDPAARRLGFGSGHGHGGHGHGHGHGGHGEPRPVLEVLADAGFAEPVVVGHGRTRMGAVTYYRADR